MTQKFIKNSQVMDYDTEPNKKGTIKMDYPAKSFSMFLQKKTKDLGHSELIQQIYTCRKNLLQNLINF